MATFAVAAFGLVGGAAVASPTFECNPSGRAICIATEDQDDVSHSTSAINRYTEYVVTVSNGGGSTLTNGSVTISLKDVQRTTVGAVTTETEVAPTGQFVAAPAGCTPTGPSTSFTCSVPNLTTSTPAFQLKFFARTSTDATAEAMRLIVTASFKEKGSDSEGPAAQSDSFTSRATTELEPRADFSQSIVFLGGSTTLLTAALGQTGANNQTTTFAVPVLTNITGVASLEEFSPDDPEYFCPVVGCFGQSIRALAPSIFSAANPANILTTMSISLLPRGVTENSLTIHNEVDAPFTDKCSGAIGVTPDDDELPCRRVSINRQAGIVTIDIWAPHQGDWGFS